MQRCLIFLVILLLAGCGGGGARSAGGQTGSQPGDTATGPAADPGTPGELKLALSAEQDGGQWRVNLRAPQAADLYQIAGTLEYAADRYEVAVVEAGGGLGQPENSYFVSSEKQPGRIDFAYTKRYFGPGVSGDTWLVSVRVTPHGQFNLADFELDTASGKLLARDSKKQPLAVSQAGAP